MTNLRVKIRLIKTLSNLILDNKRCFNKYTLRVIYFLRLILWFRFNDFNDVFSVVAVCQK